MAKDKCIICGDNSIFDFDTPVDQRVYYVEGAGQLCEDCWNNMDSDYYVKIPKHYLTRYSNDQILGQKVREFYNKK